MPTTRGEGGDRYKLPAPGGLEGGLGPRLCCIYVFKFVGSIIVYRLFKLTPLYQAQFTVSTVQINPLRPSPIHSATEGHSFRFSLNIFSRCPPLLGEHENIFSPWSKPVLGSPASSWCIRHSEDRASWYTWCGRKVMRRNAVHDPTTLLPRHSHGS